MSGGGEKGSATTKTLGDFLISIRGRLVVVKLNSGPLGLAGLVPCHLLVPRYLAMSSSSMLCILACLDGYMNIAMEQTEEYVNGQLKSKHGDAFIPGNNVLYVSTSKRTLADGA
ncbi:hypothetical protein ACJW30_04G013200 [Castanea mollissima]